MSDIGLSVKKKSQREGAVYGCRKLFQGEYTVMEDP
jgi:hypothetical protein